MLHVILQILAVFGIIILCILGLLLLLSALVLFVPVRYRIDGSKDAEAMFLSVKATYLLHMLSARYQFPDPGKVIIRLFGIKIAVFPKEEKHEQTSAEEQETAGQSDMTESVKQKDDGAEDAGQDSVPESTGLTDNAVKTEQGGDIPEEPGQNSETDTVLQPKKKKKKNVLQKCIYTFHSICDKIKKIAENISYYKEILTKNENRLFFGRVKKRLLKVIKSIRPRVLQANLRLGTGSPDTTGYLCGLYGMLLPVLGNHVNMTPDFEEAVWEGTLHAKGRITLFTILLQAGKILFDKQLRIFVNELKREE